MRSRLLIGKLQGIFCTVAPVVSERPCYVSVAVVIPLQGQLQFIHVLRTGASGFLQAVRIILDSYLYGIVRILDGIRTVGVPGVVWALTALKVFSPALAIFCIRRIPSEVCKATFFAVLRSICFCIWAVRVLGLTTRSFCSGWTLIFADWGAILMVRFCMVFGSSCILGFSLIRMGSDCF